MVSVEEIPTNEGEEANAPALTASQERLLDAEEIEKAAASMKRPTARMQMEALAKRIRKESEALKRVEKSHEQMASASSGDEKKEDTTDAKIASQPPAVAPAAAAAAPPVLAPSVKYVPIDRFAFDAGGYNTPFVTLYIDLPRVGSIARDNITCNFTSDSLDLIVKDLDNKSYRLFKDSLEKDIDPEKSKVVVKADKILVKLAKVKSSDYGGYDFWTKLTDPKKKKDKKTNPQAGIMDLMKQMYDEGDDQMKKVIGETMLKQQRGELGKDSKLNDPMEGFNDDDLGGM